MQPVRSSVRVGASLQDAFVAFTEQFGKWWPNDYTLSKESLDTIGIEQRVGGFCYEIGPFGFRCDWGRVLAWNSPHSLTFTWQVNPNSAPEPNPDRASEVHVSFTQVEEGQTLVELEHKNIARHGEGSSGYREELASEFGWPYLLLRFQEHIGAAPN